MTVVFTANWMESNIYEEVDLPAEKTKNRKFRAGLKKSGIPDNI